MAKAENNQAIAQELEKQIKELEGTSKSAATEEEIERLRQQVVALRQKVSGPPQDAWERVLVARHPQRPYTLDYIQMLFTDFLELHGDRRFADDGALVTGFAQFEDRPIVVVGNQKGRDTKQKLLRNFGMANPEGYRKALRVMQLASKFGLPIVCLVDTPGAYPGIGAEERGQAEAIACNLKEICKLQVPIVVIIHGEGGSGGALAIAVGDEILMHEYSVYSVISPESCSSILWRDWDHKQEAARVLKMTAEDLYSMKIVDQIVPEPKGGSHMDHAQAAELLRPVLRNCLDRLGKLSVPDLIKRRQDKLRRLATFVTEA
ncbi:MAG: acetyl-CoA carboxylase carboxyltransferase subunit alpha [Acidobacteriota bacterium]|nr:acetyl-CoA carboxylase carboxyltransferase subunit alpha [Acidobacteriota bacterium]